jgi:hypothetical protein
MFYLISIPLFLAGALLGWWVWGDVGVLFWLGVCGSYLLTVRMSGSGTAAKIFLFALAGVGLILGGGSILAHHVGKWGVVPWVIACMILLWRLRTRCGIKVW